MTTMSFPKCHRCGKEVRDFREWFEDTCPKSTDGHFLTAAEWVTLPHKDQEANENHERNRSPQTEGPCSHVG